MRELRPGLWHWAAPHPDWTPEQGGSEGWDRDVSSYVYEQADALVLFDPLSPAWDDLDERVERLGPAVRVAHGLLALPKLAGDRRPLFRHARVHGGVRVCPDSWLDKATTPEALRATLRPILDLPAEAVLLTHGEPVLQNAREALERAIAN